MDMVGWVPILGEAASAMKYGDVGKLPVAEGVTLPTTAVKKLSEGEVADSLWFWWRAFEWWAGAPASNLPVEMLRTIRKMDGEKKEARK
jgi:hypothetical protein